jgi:Chitobiase/beta-hexosaminidase C-terminal domain
MSTDIGTVIGTRVGGAPCNCGCDDACGLERVRFFPRQILGADDLNTEQRYFREKQRRHNRFLHGWGVVCGCEVRPAPTTAKPYQVVICPGYVITPQGDEIMIGCPALFDLATCMVNSDDPCALSRPCPPITTSTPMRSKLYLTVCYTECTVRPVRVAPQGCACDDAQCDYSRIRDAYEFACADSLPQYPGGPTCDDLCRGTGLTCPPCPQDDCVVLATIRIDPSRKQNEPVQIDSVTDRRLLYSTAGLQTMALCQCGQVQEPQVDTPMITSLGTGGNNEVWVQVTVAAPAGAQIYYTTDGNDPSVGAGNTTLFGANNDNVPINQDTLPVTVKAIGVHPSYRDSAVASQVITG